MAGGVSNRLRAGAVILRIGGLGQFAAAGLALVYSSVLLLVDNDPSKELPAIAVVVFLLLPVAGLIGAGGLLSVLGSRRARRREAGRATLFGLGGWLVPTIAILAFAGPWDLPTLAVAIILSPSLISLAGAAVSATSPERRRAGVPETTQ